MSLRERLEREDTELVQGEIIQGRKYLRVDFKEKIRERLVKLADQGRLDRDRIEEMVSAIMDEIILEDSIMIAGKEKQKIIAETIQSVTGFGPITCFINDPDVTEIMVNGCDVVYIEKRGRIERTDIQFKDDSEVLHIIDRIVSPLGRRIDEASPMVDARLTDGSRINAVIPPLSLSGPILTIRKFSKIPYTTKDLIGFGTLNSGMEEFLKLCIRSRLNIVICGGSGSGKTTTLNALSEFVPEDERIITIEDAAELKLHQQHVVRLEVRPPNIEGKGMVTVRDLVRNALRMRPDRIIVGEVRSGEALDMLQAMNTGHDGSLTTCHANSPRDVLARLETMTMMSGMDIPVKAIKEQIASAIDLIVHQVRFKDGSRKIINITEVQGMEGEIITLQDIYLFKPAGMDEKGLISGEFTCEGIRPKFMDKYGDAGLRIPAAN
jgi:Flp pilus assembly protein, ATPase CpaF